MFALSGNCKFERCAYAHEKDNKNNSNIEELKHEVVELKQSVKKFYESCQNEAKIKTLEEEKKVLKFEINRLFAFNKRFSKKSDFLDAEENFQMEIVDGETVYVCNICNEGLDNENEITKHIRDNHESLMNDDSYSDTDIYEGFDEEGHRIV